MPIIGNVTPPPIILSIPCRSPVELLAEHSLDDERHVTKPFAAVASPPPHPATIRAQKKVPIATTLLAALNNNV